MQYKQHSIKVFIAMLCAILMPVIGICKPGHAPIRHVRPVYRSSPIHHRMPPPPPKVHHRHHKHHSGAFWTGVSIGVFGDLLLRGSTPIPRPLVVTPLPPVVAVNPVWIPPVYETRPVYDSYGRVIRYEQVLVRAGYWQY